MRPSRTAARRPASAERNIAFSLIGSWGGPARVGAVLPADGVSYYDAPTEYRVRPGDRYTIVNDQPVLVDRGHRIVEVTD